MKLSPIIILSALLATTFASAAHADLATPAVGSIAPLAASVLQDIPQTFSISEAAVTGLLSVNAPLNGTGGVNGNISITPQPISSQTVSGGISIVPILPIAVGSGSFYFFDAGDGTSGGLGVSSIAATSIPVTYLPMNSAPVSTVPVPPAFLLLGSGLLGMISFRRRSKSTI
jgi:hypothetical protein